MPVRGVLTAASRAVGGVRTRGDVDLSEQTQKKGAQSIPSTLDELNSNA